MKVVISRCYGGFGVSQAVLDELEVESLWELKRTMGENAIRTYPPLIKAVEKIGSGEHRTGASGQHAKLVIVEIPFETVEGWHIEEYDGYEHIAENHRTW